ncbi:MAG: hypothetical protein ACTSRD_04480 [Promethearchaeota archaeon]
MVEIFQMKILNIHPSQLYISNQKLQLIQETLNPEDPRLVEPIPIKNLNGKTIFVDGHTRAVALHLLGQKTMPVYWEYEELDWNMYEICVQWCVDEGVYSIIELANRIVSHEEYKILWYKRCDDLHSSLQQS